MKSRSRYWRQTGVVASAVLASCPLLIAGLAVVFVGGLRASYHGVNQHLFAMGHRSLQHARYSSECPIEWGRVHEVRRSQPRLSGPLILEFGASSLRPGSLTPDHASHIAWGLRATWMTASGLSHLIAAVALVVLAGLLCLQARRSINVKERSGLLQALAPRCSVALRQIYNLKLQRASV
ncbi:hypothetical protein SAMN05216558_1278 [Pseudomonas vancouverensis]|nr:hypothetical protein SAMN05216558_1278 [Pseudomonas vancouverensis]